MESTLTWNNFYYHARFWRHITTWAIFLLLVAINIAISIYYNPGEEFNQEYWRIIPFMLEIAALIYIGFYAYNRLIPKKQYALFFLVLAIDVVVISLLDEYFDTTAIMIGELKGFVANLIMFPFILFVAFGFKLAYNGARQLLVIERLETRQMESELKLLRSQINPHFLFNTLNNIYSTNLDDHEKANDIILELADLLRYQLESNKKTLTSLKEEVSSLESYVELEKIRVLDCEVRIEKKGEFEQVEIVPLLLLPFVENAFKYGTGIEPGEIDMRFELGEGQLFHFWCKNKIVQKNGKIHSGGIGLNNVKKRLELMYQNKYQLDIKENTTDYIVDLSIQL